jgi:hypothetical protein
MCGNDLVARVTSPDQALDAVLFQRDCGATTDFSTQVVVLSAGQQLPDDPASAFVADCDHGAAPRAPWGGPPAAIEWRGTRELVVRYHRTARLFRTTPEVQVSTGWLERATVKINYLAVDDVTEPPNKRVNLPAGPVTTLANDARVAPVPPAGYAQR